jgi:DNA-binding NarL/FixJ family response regulator
MSVSADGERIAEPSGPSLTKRHLEILSLVARGRTNRQVGEELGISELTVRNHMRTIGQRLSSTDRTHAVVLAISHGWIPVPIEPDELGDPAEPGEAGVLEPRLTTTD